MVNEQIAKPGLMETMKNSVQPKTIAEKFRVDKNTLIDVGLYGAIGFLTGFLVKRYSEYIIFLGLFIAGLAMLQQFDYIAVSFNRLKIHDMLGLQQVPLVGDAYVLLFWEWVKANIIPSSSFIIGFLLGLKVG